MLEYEAFESYYEQALWIWRKAIYNLEQVELTCIIANVQNEVDPLKPSAKKSILFILKAYKATIKYLPYLQTDQKTQI